MLVPEGRTEDGFKTHFATNYLGHFRLTRLLLDSLVHSGKDGSCSRVISISFSAHFAADARPQDRLSILRLKAEVSLDVTCMKVLTMKIFRLDSGETPALCWTSRTRSSFTNIRMNDGRSHTGEL